MLAVDVAVEGAERFGELVEALAGLFEGADILGGERRGRGRF